MKKTNVIVVYNKDASQILMCYRKKNPYKGLYNFVGGKVNENESSIDAAYRELAEETGISDKEIQLVHFSDFTYYIDQIQLEIFVGKLFKDIHVYGEENELIWMDIDDDFFDNKKYAGEGNIGHILKVIQDYHPELLEDVMLIKPAIEYANEIKAYRDEFIENHDSMDGCGDLKRMDDPIAWIKQSKDYEDSTKIPSHYVTAEQYMLVRKFDQRVLGMIQLRHELNDYLFEFGGHIGYSVRPSERRKGYASEMLRKVLEICKKKGMDKVLITCNEDNEASRKTILKNNGIYENKSYEVDEDNYVERYWIHLR